MVLSSPYIEQRDSIYLLSGTNTSLDSVVRHFLDGKSVDGIIRSFPALTPEKVCGAVAFYLEHRDELDDYLGFEPGETEVMRGGDQAPSGGAPRRSTSLRRTWRRGSRPRRIASPR